MNGHDWTVTLYWLNLSLLVAHQVDSAYWKEWELFRIPGGNQVNLVLNLLLLLVGIGGFGLLVDRRAAGNYFSILIAVAGLFAFIIHSWFLLRGDHRFRQLASIGLLTTVLPLSIVQAVLSAAQLTGC